MIYKFFILDILVPAVFKLFKIDLNIFDDFIIVLIFYYLSRTSRKMGSTQCSMCPGSASLPKIQNEQDEFPTHIQQMIDILRDRHRNQINRVRSQQNQRGKIYRGMMQFGQKIGYGEYYFNKNAYFGMFANNLPNGQGLLVRNYKDYVKGTFKNGKVDGQANQKINGIQFHGHYSNGEKSKGVLRTQQYTYQGSFLNSKFHGYGIIQFKNGDRYEGDFQNGIYHGDGIYETQEQGSYRGEFMNGLYDGKGIFKWRDNFLYEGQYRKGNRNGFGKFIKGQSKYEGEWQNGQPKNSEQTFKVSGEAVPRATSFTIA